jgi:hypothetical protein
MSMMVHRLLLLLLLAGVAVSCGKQQPGAGAGLPTAPPSPRGPGPMSESSTNPVVIAESGDINATLQQLTQELRDYVVRTRSIPKSFEEFIAKSQVRFPPPPDGKKYAIEGQTIVLSKR